MTDLSIIVLSYNTSGITLTCIESLIKHYGGELKDSKFEIVIVDNNSSDDSVEKIKELKRVKKANIKLLVNKDNLGFGGGNNKGVGDANGKYCLFLNSDTIVKDSGFEKMVEFAKSQANIGIVGGKLYNNDGSVQPTVGIFYNLWTLFLTLFGGERLGFLRFSPNTTKKVDWVSGAFMMVDKDVFKKVGMFDENIFMYVEDMELCYRMEKAGFDVYFFPKVNVVHEKIGSSTKDFAISSIYKGILYFFQKHRSNFEYRAARFFLILKAKLAMFIGILTGNSTLVDTYKRALSF